MSADQSAAGGRRISFPPEAVFHSAIQDGDNGELWLVLSALGRTGGVDVNRRNHSGVTPLHQCVLNNNLDGVKMLLGVGADVDVTDVYGLTPLHTASACGFVHVASLLIVFGADVFARAEGGDLPVDFASDPDTARLLQDEMIARLHSEYFVASCVAYHLRRWTLSVWRTVVLVVGRLLEFVVACFRAYVGRSWSAPHSGTALESHTKTD